MSFEFIHESPELCFLSQTHHTAGSARYQTLASFRNSCWKGTCSVVAFQEGKEIFKRGKKSFGAHQEEEWWKNHSFLAVSPDQVANMA